MDESPLNGLSYYRLIQQDNDGGIQVIGSKAVTMSIEGMQSVLAYPNPVTEILFVEVGAISGSVAKVKLLNIYGQQMFSTEISNLPGTILKIPVKNYTEGIYILSYEDNRGVVSKKVLIK